MSRYMLAVFSVVIVAVALAGCATPKVKLFSDARDPLKEYTLQGKAKEKILLVSIQGVITDQPKQRLVSTKPSMVEEVVAQLQKAQEDTAIKAVILKINSPGGTVTASDILYHEIMTYKQDRDVKIVAVLMDVAASGGYYVALPADRIVAHPTTVTGSVGVIAMRPQVIDLMEKIGVQIQIDKSGQNKDMGSPFRVTTAEEQALLQRLIDDLGLRFITLVANHRNLEQSPLAEVATARIYLAEEARARGLVDQIGYLSDAIQEAKKLSGLPENARLVVYRREHFPDDNPYNTAAQGPGGGHWQSIDLGPLNMLRPLPPGFYYLWPPAAVGHD